MPGSQYPSVSDFFEYRSVFITGATGFIGKVLLEKLLRSCPGIKNIYILIRMKKGKTPSQRTQELMKSPLFDLLKKENPDALMKVVAVTGDVSLPFMGISDSDVSIMAENVSVVFHSAATIKFDEPLKQAVDMNLLGTRRMVELCHKFPKIEAVVHVSTAYATCDRNEIDEVVYNPPVPPELMIEMTRWMKPRLLEAITPVLVGDKQNTYILSKALAEQLLVQECGSLPIAIVRPSLVTSSWKEPFPGWIDGFSGLNAIIVGVGAGVIKTLFADEEKIIDYIPVDVFSNFMISVAWYTALHRPKKILVYNCTSDNTKLTTLRQMIDNGLVYTLKYPSMAMFRYPSLVLRRSQICYKVHYAIAHYFPALLIDLMAFFFFQKPRLVKLIQKLEGLLSAFAHFAVNEWKFRRNNFQMLRDLLFEEDKKTFFFDTRSLNVNRYVEDLVLGSRKYILKEDFSTVPAAIKNQRKHYILSKMSEVVLAVGVWKIIFSKFLSTSDIYYLFSAVAAKLNDIIW